jgi:hypothetical protein
MGDKLTNKFLEGEQKAKGIVNFPDSVTTADPTFLNKEK